MIQIRVCTAKLLKEDYQIEKEVTEMLFDKGILKDHVCRDALIRKEYSEKVEAKGRISLRNKLAEKYCVSVKLIEKIVS